MLALNATTLAETSLLESIEQTKQEQLPLVNSSADVKQVDSVPESERRLAMGRVAKSDDQPDDELSQGQNTDYSTSNEDQVISDDSEENASGQYASEEDSPNDEYADGTQPNSDDTELSDNSNEESHEETDGEFYDDGSSEEYDDSSSEGYDDGSAEEFDGSSAEPCDCSSYSDVDNSQALQERIDLFNDKIKEAEELGQTTVVFSQPESEALADLDYFVEELQCHIGAYKETLVHTDDGNGFAEEGEDEYYEEYAENEDEVDPESSIDGDESDDVYDETNSADYDPNAISDYEEDEELEEEPYDDGTNGDTEDLQSSEETDEEENENDEVKNLEKTDSSNVSDERRRQMRRKRVRIIRHLNHSRPSAYARPHIKHSVIRRRMPVSPHPFAHNIRYKILNPKRVLVRRVPLIRRRVLVRRHLKSGFRPTAVIRRTIKPLAQQTLLAPKHNLI